MLSELTIEQMKKLSTPRLLAYKRKVMKSQFMPEDHVWDCSCADCESTKKFFRAIDKRIEDIKTIMATREHVPRKPERV